MIRQPMDEMMVSEMSDQLTLDECRATMDAETAQVGDEELSAIRTNAYGLAGILVDAYLDFKRTAAQLECHSLDPLSLLLNALKVKFGFDDEEDLEGDVEDLTDLEADE